MAAMPSLDDRGRPADGAGRQKEDSAVECYQACGRLEPWR